MSDARLALEQVFDSTPGLDDKWRKLIDEAFAAERIREVSTAITCKCCGKERKYLVKVPLPNWSDRAKALDMLLTQAKGKPAETKKIDLNVLAVQTRADLEQLSDEELALVAAGDKPQGEVIDGKQGDTPPSRNGTAPAEAEGASGVQGSAGSGRAAARRPGRRSRAS